MSAQSPTPSHVETLPQRENLRSHAESLLDDALEGTFPCSDPLSSLSFDAPESIEEIHPPARE